MQRLNDAYAVLSDPHRRAEYDRQSRERRQVKPHDRPRPQGEQQPKHAQTAQAGSRAQHHDRREHQTKRQSHDWERQPRPRKPTPSPPTKYARFGRMISQWYGVLLVVALLVVSNSESIQQMIGVAWSWAVDHVSAPASNSEPTTDRVTQSVRQTLGPQDTPAQGVRSPQLPFGGIIPPSDGSVVSEGQRIDRTSSTNHSLRNNPGSLTRSTTEGRQPFTSVPAPVSPPSNVPSTSDRSQLDETPNNVATYGTRDMSAQDRRHIESMCDTTGRLSGGDGYRRCVEEWVQHRPDFRGLDGQERRKIESMCDTTGRLSGGAAYRRCVEEWVQHRPDFRGLDGQERRKIESMCDTTGRLGGGDAYRQCVEEWVQHRPDYRGLSRLERRKIESMCDTAGRLRGGAAYRRCVEEWVQHRPNFQGLNRHERRKIESMCDTTGRLHGAAAYRRCVDEWR